MMTGACMGGEIFQKNNECRAGEVTPAVYSPRLERSIGFILADLAYATVGTRQRVETPGVIALSR